MPEGDRVSPRRSDPLRIAVLVDKPDWHARRLIKAFAARGTKALPVPLQACDFTTESRVGLALPGFEERLPDGVFVRCVPGGSFEQVTRRLGILHALDHLGVPLCNDARAIERCVDKSMTTFLLKQAGIPTPETWTCEGEDEAREILRRETQAGHRLVLKPLFGSQGRGLQLLEGPDDLPPAQDMAGVFYLQRFVAGPSEGWQDWRIMVANGRPVAAMARRGVQWITNRHQGAECAKAPLEKPLASLASGAARAVGAAYTGVDVIRDGAGQYYVLEVNSMPAWSGLQQVNEVDITQALADALLALLPPKTQGQREAPAQHEASGA